MKKYHPNFSHAKVKNRTQLALNFVTSIFISKNKEYYLNRDYLDDPQHFGKSSNNLSKFLREILLICTDTSYRFNSEENRPKRYKLNHLGVQYLTEVLAGNTSLTWFEYKDDFNKAASQYTHINVILNVQSQITDKLFDEYQDELASGNFLMKKIGFREYHRLQTIPRDQRRIGFAKAGYIHDYDIETAAPALLLQRARKEGLTYDTEVIDYFLKNKVIFRNAIAQDCGIDYKQSKQLITALFQGGIISSFKDNKIYRDILLYNKDSVIALQNNSLIKALKEEIRQMWIVLSKNLPRETYVDKNGVTKKSRIVGKQKAQVYGEVEEVVMKSVKKFLKTKEKGVRFITEHDGWRTDRLIDLDQLRTYVRRQTGYTIDVDHTSY